MLWTRFEPEILTNRPRVGFGPGVDWRAHGKRLLFQIKAVAQSYETVDSATAADGFQFLVKATVLGGELIDELSRWTLYSGGFCLSRLGSRRRRRSPVVTGKPCIGLWYRLALRCLGGRISGKQAK
jgi:hypothetical protein